MLFGVICVRSKITIVITHVVALIPASPKSDVAALVTSAIAPMFSTVVPMRMVVRNRVTY
jgi:hypothetical protein